MASDYEHDVLGKVQDVIHDMEEIALQMPDASGRAYDPNEQVFFHQKLQLSTQFHALLNGNVDRPKLQAQMIQLVSGSTLDPRDKSLLWPPLGMQRSDE